jgi:hypothetical protein
MSIVPYNYDSKPTQPADWTEPELDTEDCTTCPHPIYGERDVHGFEPQDGRKDGKGWIHDSCIPAKVQAMFSDQEKLEYSRLRAAMVAIQGTPVALLEKLDNLKLVELDLAGMRETVCDQLLEHPFSAIEMPDILLVRVQDLVTAKAALIGEYSRPGIDPTRAHHLKLAAINLSEARHA